MKKEKHNRLKEVLFKKGISQTELADKLGVKPQTIQQVCSNRTQMSIQRMREIAIILNVNVCELIEPVPVQTEGETKEG